MRTAHARKTCHNWKDEGVAHYGGKVFKEIRDAADDTFNAMKAPLRHISAFQRAYCLTGNKHTDEDATGCNIERREMTEGLEKNRDYRGKHDGTWKKRPTFTPQARQYQPAPVQQQPVQNIIQRSMAIFNDPNRDECFSGDSTVQVRGADATVGDTKVRSLRKGDEILVAGGVFSAVECVVHTTCAKSKPMWRVGDADLTEWHPVRIDGVWAFPGKVGTPTTPVSEVYNLVLEGRAPAVIGGIEVCTLGHNDFSSDVIAHDYFGTDACIRDLEGLAGWTKGRVELESGWLAIDPATGRVCAMRRPSKL